MSLSRRLIKSFGATLLGPVVTLAVQLINVPVMLRCWGPELYGEWIMLAAMPTYLMLTDLGFGNVAASDMTMRMHAGDKQGALVTLQSTMVLVGGLSLLLAAVLGLLYVSPLPLHLGFAKMPAATVRLTLLLLSLNCLVLLQWSVLMAAFRATGRYAYGMLCINIFRVLESATFPVLLLTHAGPAALAGVMLTISVLGSTWLLWQHQRQSAELPLGVRHATAARVRDLTPAALAFAAFPACAALGTQGLTLVTGFLLGPVAVAVFNPMRTLSRVVLQVADAVKNATWPELSAAYGRQDWPLTRRLHRSSLQFSMLLAGAALLFLAVTGQAIFRHWTRGELPFEPATFYLLLLAAFANAVWNTSVAVPMSSNRHGRVSLMLFSLTAASLAGSVLLVRFGLSGVAGSMLLVDGCMAVVVLRISSKLLGEPVREIVASLFDMSQLRAMLHSLRPGRLIAPFTGKRDAAKSLPTSRSIPSLDGLRAVAVLMVVLSHFAGVSSLPRRGPLHLLLTVLGQGGLGVTAFFIISGMLITTLLLREREAQGSINLWRFYFRRSLRIFPPYYVYLAVAAGVAWVVGHPMPWQTMAAALTYVSNYYPYAWSHPETTGWLVAHTWSLSVEEQFYLLWPLLLLMLRGRHAIKVCVGILLSVTVLRALTVQFLPIYAVDSQWFRLFHTTADALLVGCILAFLLQNPKRRARISRSFHPVLLVSACVFLAGSGAFVVHAPVLFNALLVIPLTSICLAYLLVYTVLRPETIAGRVLNWAPCRHLGMISYSIYLWQQLFLDPLWGTAGIGRLLMIFACAETSYWLIESPILRIREPLETYLKQWARRRQTSYDLLDETSPHAFQPR